MNSGVCDGEAGGSWVQTVLQSGSRTVERVIGFEIS